MRVKICGITNEEDALLAVRLGADALGFVFYPGSKRFIRPEKVKRIIEILPPFVDTVGVFVNETSSKVNKIADYLKLDYSQLHGDENPDYIEKINNKVIKAFRINSDFNFDVINGFDVDYYLLDTYSKSEFGGTGEVFNWQFVPKGIMSKSILAGGISPNNIEMIYNNYMPAAVDLSSSIETRPGKKNRKKINEFFIKVNNLRQKW